MKIELAFYCEVEDEDAKTDSIFDHAFEVMCDHDGSDDARECNMVHASAHYMTEQQFDAWFDRVYPEFPENFEGVS